MAAILSRPQCVDAGSVCPSTVLCRCWLDHRSTHGWGRISVLRTGLITVTSRVRHGSVVCSDCSANQTITHQGSACLAFVKLGNSSSPGRFPSQRASNAGSNFNWPPQGINFTEIFNQNTKFFIRHNQIESAALGQCYLFVDVPTKNKVSLILSYSGQLIGATPSVTRAHPYFGIFIIILALANVSTLLWRHNGRNGVSNRRPHDCLLNHLFRGRTPRPWFYIKMSSNQYRKSHCGDKTVVR